MTPAPATRRVPFLVVGDAPEGQTGLGRILRDLVTRLTTVQDRLGLDVQTCCWTNEVPTPLDRFTDTETWGRGAIADTWLRRFGHAKGILFTIFDPARCYEYLALPMTKWGYFPVDAADVHGSFGGPAAEAVRRYDRVLAYSPYGRRVLATIRPELGESEWLPHGVDEAVWTPTVDHANVTSIVNDAAARGWLRVPAGRLLIGVVATNQPRKDLGVVFAAVRRLIDLGWDVHLWLHTDELVRAWSVPQLAETYDLESRLSVSFHYEDWQLAAIYRACVVTIAPGRGEGFGYPIVESQLSGTPAVAMDYAGGADFTYPQGLLPPTWAHVDGPYNLVRPVWDVEALALKLDAVLGARRDGVWPTDEMVTASEYLRWDRLWPAWQAWIEEGLAAYRAAEGD